MLAVIVLDYIFSATSPTPVLLNPSPTVPYMLTICSVPASAAKAETGGLFLNGQEVIPIHDILKAQVRMKRSKAFDMHYHWLKD
jgi:hypothetical protein